MRLLSKSHSVGSCSRWGLPKWTVTRHLVGSYPHRFTLTHAANGLAGGLLSVALSLTFRPVDVIDHLARWSPDFPPCTSQSKGYPLDPPHRAIALPPGSRKLYPTPPEKKQAKWTRPSRLLRCRVRGTLVVLRARSASTTLLRRSR